MSGVLAALALYLAAPSPPHPSHSRSLTESERCFEDLDYACAELHLATALRALDLTDAERTRARLLDAQLGIAYRDMPRVRRAVRALFEIDPRFDPERDGPIQPELLKLFDQERPIPAPPPRGAARADLSSLQLFGEDAKRWSYGLGFEIGGSLVLLDAVAIELSVGYSNHVPQWIALDSLALYTTTLGVGWTGHVGPVRLTVGGALGLARTIQKDVLGERDYTAGLVQLPVDLSYPIWRGFGVGLRVAPGALLAVSDDSVARSFVLPLMVGIRYE